MTAHICVRSAGLCLINLTGTVPAGVVLEHLRQPKDSLVVPEVGQALAGAL
jgi:hypothetical protein